jgi:hypothetical protein
MSLSNVSGGAVAEAPAAAPVLSAPTSTVNGVKLIDAKNATVVDSQGRLIKVKKLSAFDKMRLYRAIGSNDAENVPLMNYATLAAAVTEMDGVPSAFPISSIQIDAMVQRLDEHGLEAVLNAFVALSPATEVVADAARNL